MCLSDTCDEISWKNRCLAIHDFLVNPNPKMLRDRDTLRFSETCATVLGARHKKERVEISTSLWHRHAIIWVDLRRDEKWSIPESEWPKRKSSKCSECNKIHFCTFRGNIFRFSLLLLALYLSSRNFTTLWVTCHDTLPILRESEESSGVWVRCKTCLRWC